MYNLTAGKKSSNELALTKHKENFQQDSMEFLTIKRPIRYNSNNRTIIKQKIEVILQNENFLARI